MGIRRRSRTGSISQWDIGFRAGREEAVPLPIRIAIEALLIHAEAEGDIYSTLVWKWLESFEESKHG